MSSYIIQESTLQDIANAIKNKSGDNKKVKVSEMADKINSLPIRYQLGSTWKPANVSGVTEICYFKGAWFVYSDMDWCIYRSTDGINFLPWGPSQGSLELAGNSMSNHKILTTDGNVLIITHWTCLYASFDGENYEEILDIWDTGWTEFILYPVYLNNMWICACGMDNHISFGSSLNGTNWTFNNSTILEDQFLDIYRKIQFYCVGGVYYFGDWYSLDGKTWQQNTAGVMIEHEPMYNGQAWIYINELKQSKYYYSTNGYTWNEEIGQMFWGIMDYNQIQNYFFVVGSEDLFRSSDGISWEEVDSMITSPLCITNNILFINQHPFISECVLYSEDFGESWKQFEIGGETMYMMKYLNNKYYLESELRDIYISTSPEFTSYTSCESRDILEFIEYMNGAYYSRKDYSIDGFIFTPYKNLQTQESITFNALPITINNQGLATDANGQLYYSCEEYN